MNALASFRVEVSALDATAASMRSTTDRLFAREIANGAARYVRQRDLPKLIPAVFWTGKSDTEICSMLASYISGTAKGLAAGHWAADSNRLMALRMALAAERAR